MNDTTPHNQEEAPAADTKPTVLVVDDDRGPRESLRYLLKNDYRVLCADSVDHGLQFAQEQQVDVVIMDIRMPVKSGIDGLRELRRCDADVSIIMLTGFASLGTAQEAMRNAASDYLEKPFDAADMRRTIAMHAERTSLRRKRSRLLAEALDLTQRLNDFEEKSHLAELGQLSAEFVHDLRNALAIMPGSSEMLREEVNLLIEQAGSQSEASVYLNSIESSMRQCMEMLDVWQNIVWQTPEQLTTFNVHDFVIACVESNRAAARSAGAQLACETLGADRELTGNPTQLTRALSNLIHNALRALPPERGEVHIRSQITPECALISVADNGCGIKKEHLTEIFAPTFTTRRAQGGKGLGLFITQKIAQAHGGSVTVESAVDQGSTFSIRLPFEPPPIDGSPAAKAAG